MQADYGSVRQTLYVAQHVSGLLLALDRLFALLTGSKT